MLLLGLLLSLLLLLLDGLLSGLLPLGLALGLLGLALRFPFRLPLRLLGLALGFPLRLALGALLLHPLLAGLLPFGFPPGPLLIGSLPGLFLFRLLPLLESLLSLGLTLSAFLVSSLPGLLLLCLLLLLAGLVAFGLALGALLFGSLPGLVLLRLLLLLPGLFPLCLALGALLLPLLLAGLFAFGLALDLLLFPLSSLFLLLRLLLLLNGSLAGLLAFGLLLGAFLVGSLPGLVLLGLLSLLPFGPSPGSFFLSLLALLFRGPLLRPRSLPAALLFHRRALAVPPFELDSARTVRGVPIRFRPFPAISPVLIPITGPVFPRSRTRNLTLGAVVAWSARAGRPDRGRRSYRCPNDLRPKQDHSPVSHRRSSPHRPVDFIHPITRHAGPGFALEAPEIDAAIHHSPVDHGVARDVDGVSDQGDVAGARHDDPFDTRAEKARGRHETPGIPTAAEIGIGRREADARLEPRFRRERRPTDIAAAAAPADPRRPHSVPGTQAQRP